MKEKDGSVSSRTRETELKKKKKDQLYRVDKEVAKTKRQVVAEINELRVRLREIRKIFQAVKDEDIDVLTALRQVYNHKGTEHLYYLLFRNINQGALVLFADGKIIYCNKRFAELVNRPIPKTLGSRIFDFVSGDDVHFLGHLVEEGRKRLGTRGEIQLKTGEGKFIPVDLSVTPVFATKGVIVCVIITDLSEQRRKEQELKKLTSELLAAQEKERKRIAAELHDGLGSALAGIKLKVEDLFEKRENGRVDKKDLETTVKLIQECTEEIRRIQMDLRPPMLDDLGILSTLHWFCREYQSTHPKIQVAVQLRLKEEDVPDTLKSVIFRVCQEALHNVSKHSTATLVHLNLRKVSGAIELAIQDNGQGFNIQSVLSGESGRRGLGLSSMKERVVLAGGSFDIGAEPGKGAWIRACWQT